VAIASVRADHRLSEIRGGLFLQDADSYLHEESRGLPSGILRWCFLFNKDVENLPEILPKTLTAGIERERRSCAMPRNIQSGNAATRVQMSLKAKATNAPALDRIWRRLVDIRDLRDVRRARRQSIGLLDCCPTAVQRRASCCWLRKANAPVVLDMKPESQSTHTPATRTAHTAQLAS